MIRGCLCSQYDSEEGRYRCSVSGGGCMYLIPNSVKCALDFGEGPDAGMSHEDLLLKLHDQNVERSTINE